MCCKEYIKNTEGRIDRASNPADNNSVIANEVAVYEPDESHMNPSSKAINTSARLLQSRWCISWSGGQDLRCEEELSWGPKKLESISLFQDYLIIPTNFPKNLQHFPNNSPIFKQITSPNDNVY